MHSPLYVYCIPSRNLEVLNLCFLNVEIQFQSNQCPFSVYILGGLVGWKEMLVLIALPLADPGLLSPWPCDRCLDPDPTRTFII